MSEHQVHQVRVLFSLRPDKPQLAYGYGIDVRQREQDEWRPYASVALPAPTPLGIVATMAIGRASEAARSLPIELPFS